MIIAEQEEEQLAPWDKYLKEKRQRRKERKERKRRDREKVRLQVEVNVGPYVIISVAVGEGGESGGGRERGGEDRGG